MEKQVTVLNVLSVPFRRKLPTFPVQESTGLVNMPAQAPSNPTVWKAAQKQGWGGYPDLLTMHGTQVLKCHTAPLNMHN